MNSQFMNESLKEQAVKQAAANRKYVYDIMMTTYQRSLNIEDSDGDQTNLKSNKKSKKELEYNADSVQFKTAKNLKVPDLVQSQRA